MRNFRYLHIWKRSYKFTLDIYKHTKNFPKNELYGLVSQIRRSSASMPSNISEGCGKDSDSDYARYIEMALSSSFETDNHLMLSKDLEYLSEKNYNLLNNELDQIKKMISSYLSKLREDIEKKKNMKKGVIIEKIS